MWVVLAVGLAVRLVLTFQLEDHPLLRPEGMLDDAAYVQLARRVAAGDWALAPAAYYVSPFYTYFLGAILALGGGSILAARLIQGLLGSVTIWFVMRAAEDWYGEKAGLAAGVLATLTGLFAFNELLILQSSVDPFLTGLSLYLVSRALRSPSIPALSISGCALGLLVLNRPNALPAVLAVPAVWFLVSRSRKAFLEATALVVGVALIVSPVTIRNRVVSGEWVLLTSHGGLNFYIGNGDGADGTWHQVPGVGPWIEGQERDVKLVASQALGHDATSREADSYFYGRARSWIAEHPGQWTQLLLRKLVLTLSSSDAALNHSFAFFARDERSILSLLVVGPWLLVPLGLFGLAVAPLRTHRLPYLAWLSFAIVYPLTLVAFFVSSRYRLPFLVPLLVGCGGAVEWISSRDWPRIERGSVVSLAGLAGLAVLVNWPMPVNDGRMDEREQYIVTLIGDGRLDAARRLLEDTVPLHPRPGLLLDRVALTFRERGDRAEALRYLERAFEADGGDPRIRLNLGESLLEAGRAQESIPHLAAAREAGLSPFTATLDLALALESVGSAERARQLLATVPVSPQMTTDGLLSLGNLALRLQAPAYAEPFLREATSREPGNAEAHHLLGICLGLRGDGQGSRVELQQASRLAPEDVQIQFHLGLALVREGRMPEARAALAEVLRLQPDNADAERILRALPR